MYITESSTLTLAAFFFVELLLVMDTDKTPEEVAREFNITEPFSPEVEKKLRKENKWSTEPPVSR